VNEEGIVQNPRSGVDDASPAVGPPRQVVESDYLTLVYQHHVADPDAVPSTTTKPPPTE